MKVCIAEKPSVAREIAQILGATSKKEGYLEGNGYRVTWTFGHLCTLKEPDEYTPEWKKWNLSTLPMLPEKFDIKLISNAGVGKQFKVIKSLVDNCDEVINCGDAGIEGELIQRW
ncbi:MAG TPA: toprim domain-containing protein, partial [Spirochaetota bacterium]|nr:toprim domain-containing protein [Spirochaetota bacterium]